MEVIALMGCAACAGSAALLALPAEDTSQSGVRRLSVALPLRLALVLRRLSATRLAQALCEVSCWESAARETAALVGRWGPELSVEESCALLLLAQGLSGVATGALFGSVVAGLASLGALLALVPARAARARSAQARELMQEMPSVFRTLSVAMGSGQTLAQAVEYVGAHERGPAAEVFTRLSLRLRCGISTEVALDALASELDAPGVDLLATALVISHRTGSPLRDLLVRSARLVERQGEFKRLLAVKTAQVRLSVRIVCALPAIMVLLLAMISPDFQRGLLTLTGVVSVSFAAALDVTALLIIRRLMRGVL